VGEQRHLADAVEIQLFDLRADDLDELRIDVERRDRLHLRLLGEVLRHVAERAADFEHRQVAGAAGPEPAEERVQIERSALLLEREIEGSARSLARDEHLDHALAVAGRMIGPTVHGEHAAVAEILDAVVETGHRSEYSGAGQVFLATTSSMWPSSRS